MDFTIAFPYYGVNQIRDSHGAKRRATSLKFCTPRTTADVLLTVGMNTMTLQQMVNAIKNHPDFAKVGMIACHNGVVRATSRDGRDVEGLRIEVEWDALESIVQEMRQRPGIVEVAVHLFEGYREIGQDVMLVTVAGDIREHVFPVLEETVERLKKEVTRKEEYITG
jgi:molybdopterin synthase catalytic subunit